MKQVIKVVIAVIVIAILNGCASIKPVKPIYRHGQNITKYHKQLKTYYETTAYKR